MKRSPNPRLRLYVVCHDDTTEERARHMCARYIDHKDTIGASTLRLSGARAKTPFCESAIFLTELPERKTADGWCDVKEEYVGVLTYAFEEKAVRRYFKALSNVSSKEDGSWTSRDWEEQVLHDAVQRDLDVVGLLEAHFYKNGKRVSMLDAAVFNHGVAFYRAWHGLLTHLGYTDDQIVDPKVPCYISNWWIARPARMNAYIAFYRRAYDTLESSPSLSALFSADSFYRSDRSVEDIRSSFGGRDYFTLHPFVFERLPGFFFYHLLASEKGASSVSKHMGRPTVFEPHVIHSYD